MIIDKIENHHLYNGISKRISIAFDFIKQTDLVNIPLGKHEILKDDVFAIAMEYETKNKSECKFEGHYKYIDLQFIVSGSELVGIRTLTNQIPVETNIESDYSFYDIDSDLIRFESKTFMLFFPDDLHMPGVHLDQASNIKKVVVKIKV